MLPKNVFILAGCTTLIAIPIFFIYLWYTKPQKSKHALRGKNQKRAFKLIHKEDLTGNVYRFRFMLDAPDQVLGLPIGNHVYITARIKDDIVIRPYTPVTTDKEKGYFDLIIKVYASGVHPNFPNGGKMSQHLHSLPIGSFVDFSGPAGDLTYLGYGTFQIKRGTTYQTSSVKYLGLIAGGSGLTPMLQIIMVVLKDSKDPLKITLLFANNTKNDIILYDELLSLSKQHEDRFKVWFTITDSEPDWPYSTGYVSADMIQKHMPQPSNETLIAVCGPPVMVNNVCIPILRKLNYTDKMIFAF